MKIKNDKKKEFVLKAIEGFNEFRKPEGVAKLVEIKNNEFVVRFSGHMCFCCGTYDYFEDLMYELKELGINSEIKECQNFINYFLVKYKIKNEKNIA